jgi:IS4 transposase
MPHLGHRPSSTHAVSASAFCSARAKLDEVVFEELQVRILQQAKPDPASQWQGYRLLAVDGSKMNSPWQLIRAGYKTPSDNAHYPQGTVSCLYELKSKIPVDFDLSKQGDERAMGLSHLNSLSENDVVVYDRGYYSYDMLHKHIKHRIHPIFRLKRAACGVVEAFANSDDIDAVVQVTPYQLKHSSLPALDQKPDYPTLSLRLVKYDAGGTSYILGTTLWDQKKYSIKQISAVYHSRWGIEELYKVSKQLMKVEDFHAQSERGVKQELFANFNLITLTRLFANHSEDGFHSQSAKNDSEEHAMKANFKNCLMTVARNIEALLLQQTHLLNKTVNIIIASMSTCR